MKLFKILLLINNKLIKLKNENKGLEKKSTFSTKKKRKKSKCKIKIKKKKKKLTKKY